MNLVGDDFYCMLARFLTPFLTKEKKIKYGIFITGIIPLYD